MPQGSIPPLSLAVVKYELNSSNLAAGILHSVSPGTPFEFGNSIQYLRKPCETWLDNEPMESKVVTVSGILRSTLRLIGQVGSWMGPRMIFGVESSCFTCPIPFARRAIQNRSIAVVYEDGRCAGEHIVRVDVGDG